MIVAVFGDVHGNLPALEIFLERVRHRADGYLCLGDTVNYGPWNDECLERIADLPGITVVEGNHERLFLDAEQVRGQHPLVQQFYAASRQCFTRVDLITDLPQTAFLGSFTCVHTIDGQRIFPDTQVQVEKNYLVGHSHHQFDLCRGARLVNPGSVGQNRGRIDRIEYALFDTETESFLFESVPYDARVVVRELRARGYPPACVEYYETKLARCEG